MLHVNPTTLGNSIVSTGLKRLSIDQWHQSTDELIAGCWVGGIQRLSIGSGSSVEDEISRLVGVRFLMDDSTTQGKSAGLVLAIN